MTMLNISCFPLGNSVRLERDLVFHRNMSNFGTDCRSLGSCVFLFYFFILFFLPLCSKIGLGGDA